MIINILLGFLYLWLFKSNCSELKLFGQINNTNNQTNFC